VRRIAVLLTVLATYAFGIASASGVRPKGGTSYKGLTGMCQAFSGTVGFSVAKNAKSIQKFKTGACAACKANSMANQVSKVPFTMGSIPVSSKGRFKRAKRYTLHYVPQLVKQGAHPKPKKVPAIITVAGKFRTVGGQITAAGTVTVHEFRKQGGKWTKRGCQNIVMTWEAAPA
jgi:hypothetical protein